jgi:hypothetical protein
MRGEEDLLQQILRFDTANHPARQSEQPRRVRPIQLLERPTGTLSAPLSQREVWVPLHGLLIGLDDEGCGPGCPVSRRKLHRRFLAR